VSGSFLDLDANVFASRFSLDQDNRGGDPPASDTPQDVDTSVTWLPKAIDFLGPHRALRQQRELCSSASGSACTSSRCTAFAKPVHV